LKQQTRSKCSWPRCKISQFTEMKEFFYKS
jgi:hypothetical protein